MHRKQLLMIGILTMVTILASVIVILTISKYHISSSSSECFLINQNKCNPNNPASKLNPVNTTESRICGIPVTVKPHPSNATAASSPNIATGAEASPSTSSPSPLPQPPSTSIAPEAAPPSEQTV